MKLLSIIEENFIIECNKNIFVFTVIVFIIFVVYSNSLNTLQWYCQKGVRVFILSIPDNPTSQIPSDEFLCASHEILVDYNGVLVLDFAYKARTKHYVLANTHPVFLGHLKINLML